MDNQGPAIPTHPGNAVIPGNVDSTPESAADLIKPHSRGTLLGGRVEPQPSNTGVPDEAQYQHAHRGFTGVRTPSRDFAPDPRKK